MTYANNSSTSKDSLEKRIRYENLVKQNSPLLYGDDRLMDIWTKASQKYGRIDLYNQVIYPDEAKMKHFDDAVVFDFVADCLSDMREYINSSIALETLDPSVGKLFPVQIKTGYLNIHKEHTFRMQSLINAFYREMTSTGKTRDILDFKDFADHLLDFSHSQAPDLVFTKSQHYSSKSGSPMMSGLFLEMKTLPHDNDRDKVGMILDNNFPYLVEAARRHGFFIDKNAPWRLVVDIRSCYVRNKLKSRGVHNTIQFFESYYTQSPEVEVENMITLLREMWNLFCTAEPSIDRIIETSSGVALSLHRREKLTDSLDLPNRFWAKTYIKIRAMEMLGDATSSYITDLLSEVEGFLEHEDWQIKVGKHIEKQLSRKKYKNSLTSGASIYTIVEQDCPDITESETIEPEACEITDDDIILPTIDEEEEVIPAHISDSLTGRVRHAAHTTPISQESAEENERRSEIEDIGPVSPLTYEP